MVCTRIQGILCRLMLTFTLVLFVASFAVAGNIQRGVGLQYKHLTGNTYQIFLTVEGNCGNLHVQDLYNSTPEVCIFYDSSYVASINLSLASPQVSEYLCTTSPDSSNCTNLSFPYPGRIRFTYTGTYTLPSPAHFWRFVFAGNMGNLNASRGADVTNITTPGSTNVALIDTLDNTWADNTSMLFTYDTKMLYCAVDSFDPGVIDADGDSLQFSLINTLNGTATCSAPGTFSPVSYVTPYTGSDPLQNVSYSVDPETGKIVWDASTMQLSVVFYQVREFRGGVFVGSSMREIQIFVTTTCSPTCTDTLTTGVPTLVTQNGLSVFPDPVSDIANVKLSGYSGMANVSVCDVFGRCVSVQEQPIKTDETLQLNTTTLSPGIYILQIVANGQVLRTRIQKVN